MVKMETRRRYSLVVMSLIVLLDCIFICFPSWTYCSLWKMSQMYFYRALCITLLLALPFVHWSVNGGHKAQQFFPKCYRVMLSESYPGFIRPHAVLQHNSTLTTEVFGSFIFFGALTLLFSSLITYFLCGSRHFMFALAQVVFWPRTEWAAMGGREPDSPVEFTPTASVHPWPPPPPHLSCCTVPPFIPLLLPFSTSSSSPCSLSVFPLTCSWLTAAPAQLNPWRWPRFMTYYTLPVSLFMSFICRVWFGTSWPHVELSSPTLVDWLRKLPYLSCRVCNECWDPDPALALRKTCLH